MGHCGENVYGICTLNTVYTCMSTLIHVHVHVHVSCLQNSLLHQLHNGTSVHEELVMITSLRDGSSMTVNDIHDLDAGKLVEY